MSLVRFEDQNADVLSWIYRNQSAFALSLRQCYERSHSLSEKQIASVRSSLKREQETKLVPDVRHSNLKLALDRAREKVQRPKLHIGDLVFSRAEDGSRNPGAVYVTSVTGTYLGKIVGDQIQVKAGPAELEVIQAVMINPKEAAIADGKRTSRCSCCGRTLLNQISIDMGIGPICAERFGF